MNAIDSGMNVFFIQNALGSERSNTNTIPWSGFRLKRYMSPVVTCSLVFATSAMIFWPLIVRGTVGSSTTVLAASCGATTIATNRVSRVRIIVCHLSCTSWNRAGVIRRRR